MMSASKGKMSLSIVLDMDPAINCIIQPIIPDQSWFNHEGAVKKNDPYYTWLL